MTRRPPPAPILSLVLALGLVAGCTATHRNAPSAPPSQEVREEGEALRNDQPERAAEYFAARRTGTADRYEALAIAREQMRTMPRYSTSSDRLEHRTRRAPHVLADATTKPYDTWRFLGPGNIGGRTRAFLIDSARPEIMYAGGVSGGVWKSWDAGQSWTPIGDDLANIAINSLAMHPVDHRILYAGTGEGYFRESERGTSLPLRGDGIFLTRDGGTTWIQLASTTGTDFDYVNDLVVSTHDPRRVYAATRSGVWRSDDEGATWSQVLPTTVRGGCLDLAWRGDTTGDYLFASCGTFEQATVYRNQNAQSDPTWVPVLSEPDQGRTTLAIAPSNPSIIYALAASNENGNYNQALKAIYRSNANGDAGSWTTQLTNKSSDYVDTLLLSNVYSATNDQCRKRPNGNVTMGWYCNTIAVDPVNPERVWVGGVDTFRSDDGGKSFGIASYWWEREDFPTYLHADQHAIVFHPRYDGVSNKQVFFANDGGIARTDDALAEPAHSTISPCLPTESKFKFTGLSNSYGVTQFYHGSVSPDGRTFIAGAQDNGTLMGTIDGGVTWRRAIGGDGSYTAIDPSDPFTMYGSSQYANLYRSVNGGYGWQPARNAQGDDYLFITPFVLDAAAPSRLWLGGRKLWRTETRGEQWFAVSTALPGLVSAIAVAPGKSDLVLVGLNTGHIVRNEAATSAHGQTEWLGTKPRDGFVTWITFDPFDTNTVYATYAGFGGDHLWRSTDAGKTWTAMATNLPDIPLHSLALDPTRRERLYLGTDLGVFVSLDGGATWAVENTGFANAVTETVIIGKGEYGPAVYAFTHGRGAWRAELVFPGPKRRVVR
jgi:photosystem II stability/assembly factor-like uncharacterized protein